MKNPLSTKKGRLKLIIAAASILTSGFIINLTLLFWVYNCVGSIDSGNCSTQSLHLAQLIARSMTGLIYASFVLIALVALSTISKKRKQK